MTSKTAPIRETLAGIKVIDADTHLNEPYDLWTSRASAAWRDRIPKVEDVDGEPTWMIDGQDFGPTCIQCIVRFDGEVRPRRRAPSDAARISKDVGA